jgi:hypothetical protein
MRQQVVRVRLTAATRGLSFHRSNRFLSASRVLMLAAGKL